MNQKLERDFWCSPCKIHWASTEYAEDTESGAVVANCGNCQRPTAELAPHCVHLTAAWQASTGPRTPEGKARSRLNSFKHGGGTRIPLLVAPALTGKFPDCDGCEYRVDCETGYKYCPVYLKPMLSFIAAYEEGSISDLKGFAGLAQGRTYQALQMMFSHVLKKGVALEKVVRRYQTEDGNQVTEVLEHEANPMLKLIPQYLHTLGFTADQQAMTPQADSLADREFEGKLSATDPDAEMRNFTRQMQQNLLVALKAHDLAAEMRRDDERLKQFEANIQSEASQESDDTLSDKTPADSPFGGNGSK